MKITLICIPTLNEGGLLSDISMHFGKTPYFTFIKLEDGGIKSIDVIESFGKHNGGSKTPAEIILSSGANVLICGNLGSKAVSMLRDREIEVFSGASGKVKNMDIDIVVTKLDAHDDSIFKEISCPVKGLHLGDIIKGIKKFRNSFKGRFELQTMFTGKNKDYTDELARIAVEIQPDRLYINTLLRRSPETPLSEDQMDEIEGYFEGLDTFSVYKSKKYELYKEEVLKRRLIHK
ncbi:MAG: NifB/NifX family molybdenum-iron cluster-binding protein [Methanobacterium sp.]